MMMWITNNIRLIAYIALAVLVVFAFVYIGSLKSDIEKQDQKIAFYKSECTRKNIEKELLKKEISDQNKAIEDLRVSNEKALKELKKWRAKKPEIKYKVIEKIRKVKSDECKDIKGILNGIRSIDYNSLL